MNSAFLYKLAPADYPACTSESCSHRTHCLHALIAPEALRTASIYPMINLHYPNFREGSACEHFRSAEPEQYAGGFARAMNELSRSNYVSCTNYMIGCYSKTQFYRLKRGDILLAPKAQQEILHILRSYGYEGEDPFEHYESRYTWY